MKVADIHKKCPNCGKLLTADDILSDPEVVPIGMCFDDDDFEQNLYMFSHVADDCNTTFGLPVERFSAYIADADNRDNLAGSESCEHHCLTSSDLSTCSLPCYFASYRHLLLQMIESKKTGKPITLNNAG